MLALCLMLLATYYAQNYSGIIGWSLVTHRILLVQSQLSIHSYMHHSFTAGMIHYTKSYIMHQYYIWVASIYEYTAKSYIALYIQGRLKHEAIPSFNKNTTCIRIVATSRT